MGLLDTIQVLGAVPSLLTVKKALKSKPANHKDCIARLLERNADQHGDRTAVVFEGLSLTWGELNAQSNQIAHALKSIGIGQSDIAALFVENRIEYISCMLALNKLGAIGALVNTGLRSNPLKHCIVSTNAKIMLFGTELADVVDDVRSELGLKQESSFVAVADGTDGSVPDWALDLAELIRDMPTSNHPETQDVMNWDPCMYIFTSGTTGLPKAAIVSNNRFLSAAKMAHLAGLKATPKDRIYLCTPLYHGTSTIVGVGAALSSGASIYLRRKFSVSAFLPEVRKHGCNMFVYVGELCRFLHNSPRRPDDGANPIVSILGNGLRPDIWEDFADRFRIPRVIEFYGASEGNASFANLLNKKNTIGLTTTDVRLVEYDVDADELRRSKTGSLVVARDGEEGLCLARITDKSRFEGYTDSGATERKIIRDAFEDGDAWFNTGDLLRTVDVGFSLGYAHYQFVDRVGDTFRWRSQNVSTTQVSEVVNLLPDVDICSVYGVNIPGTEGRAGMAAVTLTEGAESLDLGSFAEQIQAQLPSYAWPVFVRVRSDVEVTGTFKLRKVELQRDGYDVTVVRDPIFVLKPRTTEYVPLDEEFHSALLSGSAGY